MQPWQRLQAAWSVLTGRIEPSLDLRPPSAAPPIAAPAAGDSVRELARLLLDLQAREGEIAKLREEYVLLEERHSGAVEAAGRDAVAALMRALAPTLSQLATLRQMAESGREVRAADALKLGGKLEQALLERGLERIGEVGAETVFDPALHQRMSGGDVRDGDPVRVRFVGYCFSGQTPVKALVSRIETAGAAGAVLAGDCSPAADPTIHHSPSTIH